MLFVLQQFEINPAYNWSYNLLSDLGQRIKYHSGLLYHDRQEWRDL